MNTVNRSMPRMHHLLPMKNVANLRASHSAGESKPYDRDFFRDMDFAARQLSRNVWKKQQSAYALKVELIKSYTVKIIAELDRGRQQLHPIGQGDHPLAILKDAIEANLVIPMGHLLEQATLDSSTCTALVQKLTLAEDQVRILFAYIDYLSFRDEVWSHEDRLKKDIANDPKSPLQSKREEALQDLVKIVKQVPDIQSPEQLDSERNQSGLKYARKIYTAHVQNFGTF